MSEVVGSYSDDTGKGVLYGEDKQCVDVRFYVERDADPEEIKAKVKEALAPFASHAELADEIEIEVGPVCITHK